MQVQIGFGNVVRIRHVVINGGSGSSVRTCTVLLSPANGRVNRHIGHMYPAWHQLTSHALREATLGMTRHGEGTTGWKTLQRCAGIREDDRSFRASGVRLVFEHKSRRLLPHQKSAEGRVPKGLQRHVRV